MKITPLLKDASKQELPAQETLAEELRQAKGFGEIRIGTEYLFYRSFIRWRFMPFCECERIYLRVEFGEYGDFPLHEHYLIADVKRGGEKKLRVERPDDAKEAMAYLQENGKNLKLGNLKLGKENLRRADADENGRQAHG